MTLLVFRTIRTGFPTARIILRNNNLPDYALADVDRCRKQVEGEWEADATSTIHHQWLEELFAREQEPFIVLDCDTVFYEPVEGWKFDKSLAGWRIPEWFDAFAGAVTMARLHTSLLFVDPVKVRAEVEAYHSQFPDTVFNPKVNLFYPLCLPYKRRARFYDTMAMMYHAIGGQSFTDDQLDSYFHMHFGSISDIVLPRLPREVQDAFRIGRARVLQNPACGRGKWREQLEWFRMNPP
jgi:hypothetical protein